MEKLSLRNFFNTCFRLSGSTLSALGLVVLFASCGKPSFKQTKASREQGCSSEFIEIYNQVMQEARVLGAARAQKSQNEELIEARKSILSQVCKRVQSHQLEQSCVASRNGSPVRIDGEEIKVACSGSKRVSPSVVDPRDFLSIGEFNRSEFSVRVTRTPERLASAAEVSYQQVPGCQFVVPNGEDTFPKLYDGLRLAVHEISVVPESDRMTLVLKFENHPIALVCTRLGPIALSMMQVKAALRAFAKIEYAN